MLLTTHFRGVFRIASDIYDTFTCYLFLQKKFRGRYLIEF